MFCGLSCIVKKKCYTYLELNSYNMAIHDLDVYAVYFVYDVYIAFKVAWEHRKV